MHVPPVVPNIASCGGSMKTPRAVSIPRSTPSFCFLEKQSCVVLLCAWRRYSVCVHRMLVRARREGKWRMR